MHKSFLLSLEDLEVFAKKIESSQIRGLILLNGPLGVGKSTFVRFFMKAFGYKDIVNSPTYSIIEKYNFSKLSIYHSDLYRIDSENEFHELDIAVSPSDIWFVEWGERFAQYLGKPSMILNFSYVLGNDYLREILVEGPVNEIL